MQSDLATTQSSGSDSEDELRRSKRRKQYVSGVFLVLIWGRIDSHAQKVYFSALIVLFSVQYILFPYQWCGWVEGIPPHTVHSLQQYMHILL